MDDAQSHLTVLKEMVPEDPQVLRLRATEATLRGNHGKARELLEQAHGKAPGTETALMLFRHYWRGGDREGALKFLEDWLEEYPRDSAARLELANIQLATGDNAKAREQYSRVLESDKDNFTALNNLAWLLRKTDTQKALEYAGKATEMQPESPSALDTMAMVLLENGDTARARRTMEDALALAGDSPTLRYHYAQILSEAGDREQAVAVLEELLAGESEFPEKEEARKLLARL